MTEIANGDVAKTLKRLIIQNREEAQVAREKLAPAQAELDKAIADLTAKYEDENFNLLLEIREADESVEKDLESLRELAIDHYKQTDEKRLDGDISVRVNTKYEYETDKAVEWAEANAPILVTKGVDKKSFESLPKAKDLDFVHVIETPIAVLAKDFKELD